MQELKVPSVGESIVEVEIGAWLKKEGESFAQDEPLVELITDKATLELPAPFAGTLKQILKKTGETARVGEAIALLEEGDCIRIDVECRRLEVLLPEEELERRRARWRPRPPAFTHGLFARYAALVRQADEGAVLEDPL